MRMPHELNRGRWEVDAHMTAIKRKEKYKYLNASIPPDLHRRFRQWLKQKALNDKSPDGDVPFGEKSRVVARAIDEYIQRHQFDVNAQGG